MIGRNIAIALTGFIVLVNLQSSVGVLHEKCLLTVAEGNCSENIQRWYYNNKTGLCQAFVYRGCNGNANNFNSTEYCYHACNVSADELHSYSIVGASSRIKGNQERSSSAAAAADSGRESDKGSSTNAVTPPSSFENARPNRPASANNGNPVASTREPTLIQNRPPESQPSKPRQAVGGATPGVAAGGSSSDSAAAPTRTRRETPNKNHKGRRQSSSEQSENESEKPAETSTHPESSPRRKKNKTVRESAREYDENDMAEKISKKNAKNGDEDHRDAIENLVSHIESTADKLQQIASIAKSGKKKTAEVSVEKDEEEHDGEEKTPKKTADNHEEDEEAEEGTDDHQEQEKREKPTKRASSPKRRHHSRKRTHTKKTSAVTATASKRSGRKSADEKTSSKSGRKLIDVSVISGDAIVERRTGSRLAEMLRMGLDEGRQAILNSEKNKNSNKGAVVDEEDDDIEIVGERIQTIIYDPSYVFSYTNITGEDMVSLQEIVSQSDVGTLQLIEKDEAKKRKLQVTEADAEKPLGDVTEVTGNTDEKSLETASARSSVEAAGTEKTVEGTSKKGDEKDKQETDTAVTEKKTDEGKS